MQHLCVNLKKKKKPRKKGNKQKAPDHISHSAAQEKVCMDGDRSATECDSWKFSLKKQPQYLHATFMQNYHPQKACTTQIKFWMLFLFLGHWINEKKDQSGDVGIHAHTEAKRPGILADKKIKNK